VDLRDADARAEVRRLDEERRRQARQQRRTDAGAVARPLGAQHHRVVDLRQAVLREDDLHHPLVHADGRGEHAAADVGQVGELEQALHGAVLAVGTVEDREDDVQAHALHDGAAAVAAIDGAPAIGAVDAEERLVARPRHQVDLAGEARRPAGLEPRVLDHFRRRHRARRALGQCPAPVLLDADRYRLVAMAIEVREDRCGGRQRHLVLA